MEYVDLRVPKSEIDVKGEITLVLKPSCSLEDCEKLAKAHIDELVKEAEKKVADDFAEVIINLSDMHDNLTAGSSEESFKRFDEMQDYFKKLKA